MERFRASRRRFIAGLVSIFGGFFVFRYLSPKLPAKKILLSINRNELPQDGALVFREERIAIAKVDGELLAMSLVCTHLGCTVTLTPEEIVCPCHGSRFTLAGKVVAGPATAPLKRYKVVSDDEKISVLI